MRSLLTLLLLLPLAAQADRCAPYQANEPPLTRAPRVLQAKVELDADRDRTYAASERLRGRAFRSSSGAMVIPYGGAKAALPDTFAAGVSAHLHQALREGVADAVVYADMGHLHLLIPDREWRSLREGGGEFMPAVLRSPELVALYHTAEMVQLKDGDFAKGRLSRDAWKQWRYFTRNLLGTFGQPSLEVLLDALELMYNTVRELPGYSQVSTVYISANRAGCFPFLDAGGQERFFDMTFEEIPYSMP